MFRESLNWLALTFTLQPEGPVLVKSGHEASADPTLLDMNFVRTYLSGYGKTSVFIPGSSLKGTLRSYTERILRTVLGEGPGCCCDPFDLKENSPTCFCGKLLENEENTQKRYHNSCPACRIFGNTALAGRLSITDAYPPRAVMEETNTTDQRDGVAIDRLLGGVAVGPFSLEIVTRGAFQTTLMLENFELWQMGLLAIVLRDLGTGFCPIGFGKTRGLGQMKIVFETLEVAYPGRFFVEEGNRNYSTTLYSVATFHSDVEKSAYGLTNEAPISLTELSPALKEDGDMGRVTFRIDQDKAIRKVLKKVAGTWKVFALSDRRYGNG